MNIHIEPDEQQMSLKAANLVAECIRKNPRSLLCFAGGDTPVPVYRRLVAAASLKQVDFRECRFVGLDEWIGMGAADEGSCRFLLERELFKPLGISEEKICFFNGKAADVKEECRKINAWVDKFGPVEVALLGIGVNGHLGFNEPGTSFDSLANTIELQDITCKVGQKYFTETKNLSMGITLGLAQIYQSRTAILVASGPNKTAIIKKLMDCEVGLDLPAGILKTHPNSHLFLDEAAALEISKP
ncbi:MAG TPA: glucosamine-6-phosphate deaminase [Firmicutes bacterium]|jgi:glucosamine-6-phosphate deaminase|nr:glucosamine-6-phosphate deaminase [Bacillota bacterium]